MEFQEAELVRLYGRLTSLDPPIAFSIDFDRDLDYFDSSMSLSSHSLGNDSDDDLDFFDEYDGHFAYGGDWDELEQDEDFQSLIMSVGAKEAFNMIF